MKAVILAAWKGTRLRPITDSLPKVMVEVEGKSLLEYNLEKLVPYVDEFILVVKYKKEVIIDRFWNNYMGIPIRYHEQGEASGTGAALWWLEIEGDCFIITSDQIFNQEDIDILAQSKYYWALAKRVNNPEKYWIFRIHEDDSIEEIIEKPKEYIGNLASLLYFKVNSEVVRDSKNIEISERWEYELLEPINQFGKNHIFKAFPLKYPFLDITSIDDLNSANLDLLQLRKPVFWESILLELMGDYILHLWVPRTQIESIIISSQDGNDTAMQKNTGDKKRFSSFEKFHSWYNDEWRYVFSLLDATWIIAWIWYWRPSEMPKIEEARDSDLCNKLAENKNHVHTWWIRIYPRFRWLWLASVLLSRSTYYYRLLYPDAYMSIDIAVDNIASQKTYEKCGYVMIGMGENRKTIEAREEPRIIYLETPWLKP